MLSRTALRMVSRPHTAALAAAAGGVDATVLGFEQHGWAGNVLKANNQTVAAPAAGQVLLKFRAAPINPADYDVIAGRYGKLPTLPAIAGNEGAAEVAAVGSGVSGLAEGDIVVPTTPGFGTWRTFAVANAADVWKVPVKIPVEYAATLSVNPCTAYRLLSDFGSLQKGDVVIQNGANGAVGQAVVQIAKARGLRTINIVRERPNSGEVIEHLKSVGGDSAVVMPQEFADSAAGRKLMGELPAPKLGLNCVGGDSVATLVRSMAENGTVVTYGGMSRKPLTAPIGPLLFNNVSLRGFWMTQWVANNSAEARSDMMVSLCDMIAKGELKLLMERAPFPEWSWAVERGSEPFRDRKMVMVME